MNLIDEMTQATQEVIRALKAEQKAAEDVKRIKRALVEAEAKFLDRLPSGKELGPNEDARKLKIAALKAGDSTLSALGQQLFENEIAHDRAVMELAQAQATSSLLRWIVREKTRETLFQRGIDTSYPQGNKDQVHNSERVLEDGLDHELDGVVAQAAQCGGYDADLDLAADDLREQMHDRQLEVDHGHGVLYPQTAQEGRGAAQSHRPGSAPTAPAERRIGGRGVYREVPGGRGAVERVRTDTTPLPGPIATEEDLYGPSVGTPPEYRDDEWPF